VRHPLSRTAFFAAVARARLAAIRAAGTPEDAPAASAVVTL